MYLPCALIVVLSWVGFWLNREATSDRVTLGNTLHMISYITLYYYRCYCSPHPVSHLHGQQVWPAQGALRHSLGLVHHLQLLVLCGIHPGVCWGPLLHQGWGCINLDFSYTMFLLDKQWGIVWKWWSWVRYFHPGWWGWGKWWMGRHWRLEAWDARWKQWSQIFCKFYQQWIHQYNEKTVKSNQQQEPCCCYWRLEPQTTKPPKPQLHLFL